MGLVNHEEITKRVNPRLQKNNIASKLFAVSTTVGLIVLAILLYRIGSQGLGYLNWDFLTSFPSRFASKAGIKSAFVGTLWMMSATIPVSLIIGVGTAIYLEEYAKKNWFTSFIQLNISNLAGVPSIVFGLLGLTVFVRGLDLGRSVLAGGLTMSLVILPVIIVSAQEALRSVPKSLREASYGLGGSKWQTILRIVLPAALPGILTGSILAFSRAIGETAPLIMVGALTYVAFLPENYLSGFTALPIQIFNWTSRPQAEFHYVAAAGILVLLGVLIVMNGVAVLIRNKFQKRY